MSSCDFSIQVSTYHDGELSPPSATALEQHLNWCSPCAEELQSMRDLSHAMRELPVQSHLSAAGLSLCHGEVEAWGSEQRDRWLMRFARGLVAIAACLLVGVGVWVSRPAPAKPVAAAPDHPWEQVAVTLQTEIPTVGGTELAADWVLADASNGSVVSGD